MSFVETIFEHLEAHPHRSLLWEMHRERERDVSNQRVLAMVAAIRGTLRQRGVAEGDRVVLLAGNRALWAATDLAILAEGAIVVPMYTRQAAGELVEMMKDADPKLVLVEGELLPAIRMAWPEAPLLSMESIASLSPADDVAPVNEPPKAVAPEAATTIIYTSGTSGRAKGVLLSRANCDFMLETTGDGIRRLLGDGRAVHRIFHYLPFCFAGSRIVLWTCLVLDNPIWMSTRLDDLKEELGGARPHLFLNVPFLLERIKNGVEAKLQERGRAVMALYQAAKAAHMRQAEGRPRRRDGWVLALARPVLFEKIRQQIGPNLEALLCGSAPLGEETQRWFEMLGIPVYQIYGLTETTAIATMDEPRMAKAGRVGYAIDGVETRITDDGELLLRGPNIFPGYWRNEEATGATFTDDGWFKTGDAAELDADGNLRIIGRTKNILIPTSGHNIAPEPIEQRLVESITGAEHVVLFGHGRPYLTAVVTGAVEVTEVERQIEVLNAELPHYRRIRKHIISEESLTPESGLLTANQKLRRRALEEHFQDTIQELYA